jgi:hypothetical protein
MNPDLHAELARAVDLLTSLIDPDPCWFDEKRSCLEHGVYDLKQGQPCPMQTAKDLVARHKPKEGSTA